MPTAKFSNSSFCISQGVSSTALELDFGLGGQDRGPEHYQALVILLYQCSSSPGNTETIKAFSYQLISNNCLQK